MNCCVYKTSTLIKSYHVPGTYLRTKPLSASKASDCLRKGEQRAFFLARVNPHPLSWFLKPQHQVWNNGGKLSWASVGLLKRHRPILSVFSGQEPLQIGLGLGMFPAICWSLILSRTRRLRMCWEVRLTSTTSRAFLCQFVHGAETNSRNWPVQPRCYLNLIKPGKGFTTYRGECFQTVRPGPEYLNYRATNMPSNDTDIDQEDDSFIVGLLFANTSWLD